MITEKGNAWLVSEHLPFDSEKKGGYIFYPTIVSQERKEDFDFLKKNGVLLDKKTIKQITFITKGNNKIADDQEKQELFKSLGIN